MSKLEMCTWSEYKYLWNWFLQDLHYSSFVLFLSRKQLRRVSYSLPMIALRHVHKAFCFTNKNGQQKQNCESLKRMWRNFAHLTRSPYQSIAWRPTGMHCWWVTRGHKRITCRLHFLHRSDPNLSFPAYLQISANGGGLAFGSVSKVNVSDSKGLTPGKWVLSRGSLHSSSCCVMNLLPLHGFYLLSAAVKRALVQISFSCKKVGYGHGQKCYVV